jgi:predicted signal transduction protein with EAL and GGDEF domain
MGQNEAYDAGDGASGFIFAAIAVVLFGFAALSLWQLKRARRELGEREVQAARAADEDKLTGLSNHGKTLELLDLALAERRDEDWTTFALIGLDGLEDVTAHHGVMGSDELVVAVARRLKQVLPVHAMCGHNLQKFIHRELPRAISANELEVYYQPIVSSQGGRMAGVEALLRWTHATRGAIEPTTFIPVAEQMGLMDTIGAFVLRRTLQNARRWPDDLYVAVNLSPLQVRDRTIVDTVRSALTESGVAPSRLVLEITEGVLIDDPDEMVKRISDLHGLGVRVALDDFGSGYSNLGYLQRFPLDKLKIDRSFVAARLADRLMVA